MESRRLHKRRREERLEGRREAKWRRRGLFGRGVHERTKQFIRSVAMEKKFHYAIDNGSVFSSAGTVLCLSAIAQGSTGTTRLGNRCKPHALSWRMACHCSGAGGENEDLRMIIFVDKKGGANDPTVFNDLLTNVAPLFCAAPLYTNADRYTILKEWLVPLSRTAGPNNYYAKGYLGRKKLDFIMKYDGAASTDYSNNCIWLCYLTNSVANTCSLYWWSRLSFYDS